MPKIHEYSHAQRLELGFQRMALIPNCQSELYLCLPFVSVSVKGVDIVNGTVEGFDISEDASNMHLQLHRIVGFSGGGGSPVCIGSGTQLWDGHGEAAIYDKDTETYTIKSGHVFSDYLSKKDYCNYAWHARLKRNGDDRYDPSYDVNSSGGDDVKKREILEEVANEGAGLECKHGWVSNEEVFDFNKKVQESSLGQVIDDMFSDGLSDLKVRKKY